MNGIPQLAFVNLPNGNRWRLYHPYRTKDGNDLIYYMDIKYAWNGESWNKYKFYSMEMGEPTELVTRDQYDDRVNAIIEHEGGETAYKWEMNQTEWEVVRDNHMVFELRKHWEAMLELKLFQPSVTL